jgi:hypothetical protein
MGFLKNFNLSIFKEQQNKGRANVFQTPILLEAVSRCAQFGKSNFFTILLRKSK